MKSEQYFGTYKFKLATVYKSISSNSTFFPNTHYFFSRSRNDENVGHLFFNTYAPVLSAVESWRDHAGLSTAVQNSVFVDVVNENRVFSKWRKKTYKRFLDGLGSEIFHGNLVHIRQYRQRILEKHSSVSLLCFNRVVVGMGKQQGLLGDGHSGRDGPVLSYMRSTLWAAADKSSHETEARRLYGGDVGALRILLLEKNESLWEHSNLVTNWVELVEGARQECSTCNVLSVQPNKLSIPMQTQLLRLADIVVSPWGGVSMLNFLMPRGKIEIILSSWFAQGGMPLPANANTTNWLTCPDFDRPQRSAFGHHTLLLCARSNGDSPLSVDLAAFRGLVAAAVAFTRHSSHLAF